MSGKKLNIIKPITLVKLITIIVALIAIYLAFDIRQSISQYNRGTNYLAEGQYKQAIECFDKAIRREKDFPEAYCYRGYAFYEKQKYDEAIRDFNKAIELNPEFTVAYYNRGMVYYNIKQYDKALEDMNKAKSLGHYVSPDFLESLYKAVGVKL